ncbi:MAG: hypothetical protein MAG431_00715 [Chloroflexi bacterium]|nr:hypothetical protein [Chloroflexota bacterium]
MMSELAQVGNRDIVPELLELSRLVAGAESTLDTLPQIVNLTQEVIIFDNLVVFLAEEGELRPYFARAVGRGRSQEADIAWGMGVAAEIYEAGETVAKKEELEGAENNRLKVRYYLGIPLSLGKRKIGVVVFIRFGGPDYEITQIRLAEFIAEHIAYLIDGK